MDPLVIGKGAKPVGLLPGMANRHGLIAGATGTGKTTTLRVLAERFSSIGVPVFLADIKGDLSGIAMPGGENPKVIARATELGLPDIVPEGFPVTFWDVYGETGLPVRTTVSEIGPLLLARILGLTAIQSDVLALIFRVADDQGMLLLDVKDLQAMARYCGDHAKDLRTAYGNISPASIGAIQRSLLALGQQGGDRLFGEPSLDARDFARTAPDGRGWINILSADRLMQSPDLYAAMLLWLLGELFERFPEVGDPEKPVMVFFFDEAHLLFRVTPQALEDRIVQLVRLIRSKGIGVYFITQNPADLPDPVLGQLGNRVHHALRAFTPNDQKGLKAAAATLRANPAFDTAAAMTGLAIGEALVSFLDERGTPSIVERALICPPKSRMVPLTPGEREESIKNSPLAAKYRDVLDRESAYEQLRTKADQPVPEAGPGKEPARKPTKPSAKASKSAPGDIIGSAAKSAARAIGTQLGREIIRGVLGSLAGKK